MARGRLAAFAKELPPGTPLGRGMGIAHLALRNVLPGRKLWHGHFFPEHICFKTPLWPLW